ncbi:MAG TPA: tRNA (guanosine(46)-N7)-methyltransferase TrmB [Candidatus Sphingobacterium stercoripullorum]|uniref:tRNA (guanine-N(7)-)-methyltransferase n=1 Tax=Candidatus Sphingobacterium stercoripullorum TaxID=2838759 RepID=A0A9D1W8D0_9SPHI|nr:tRNA (guanosine(46)-N7)-methyltransferase TrmB [Candidatus Sphingobacterium stercoripullorum]HLR50131.1 tRNA (guanosine(46)-N7)-methyltransferase TrmB [Candidatus Sphingobacterium stercoripullorum]
MAKNKLKKYAEFSTFNNAHTAEQGERLKGSWNSGFFKNKKPITLELACGKGEYSVSMAKMFPERNFIGVDLKGDRMWRGAKDALENNLDNVAFLRARIENIMDYFAVSEISEIWITFADPHPSKRRSKKRLTYERFLKLYREILEPRGILHLKTDSRLLYDSTLEELASFPSEIITATTDLYKEGLNDPVLEIKTYYERMFLAQNSKINYLQWRFKL